MKIVGSQTVHENITQGLDDQYRKIGSVMFAVGAALSIFGEFELIVMLLKLPLTVIPRFMPEDITPLSAVFYLILGNLIMLIEYQFFRKNRQNRESTRLR